MLEVIPGFSGPRTTQELGFQLPDRTFEDHPDHVQWSRIDKNFDGGPGRIRSFMTERAKDWTGVRFRMRVNAIPTEKNKTEYDFFSLRLGSSRTIKDAWTEIGFFSHFGYERPLLFTYDSQDSQTLRFFDFVIPDNWYEFSIRLKESSGPVHPYTITCNDMTVRRGELPGLSNEVVILHDSFSPTGTFSSGADMFAEEGWMYNRQGKAIWFGPELEKHQACNDDKVGKIKLFRPDDSPFYIFESYTP